MPKSNPFAKQATDLTKKTASTMAPSGELFSDLVKEKDGGTERGSKNVKRPNPFAN